MKNLIIICLFLLCSGCNQQSYSTYENVEFRLPDGYTLLTSAEVKSGFPFVNPSMTTYGSVSAKSAISMKLDQVDLSALDLERVRVGYQEYYSTMMPDIEWRESKVLDINGTQWVYLELLFEVDETYVLNAFAIKPQHQAVIIFNFNVFGTKDSLFVDDFSKFVGSLKM